ncbi:MAG: phosphate transport system regulatory protein PhoU [Gemmataceae bacterium]
MTIHFRRDLEHLQQRILGQAGQVEQTVDRAIRALTERDSQLALQVMEGDNTIDQEENEVEEECLKILALHQPVAVDLRRIAAILKINTDLERMADLAVNIAERAHAFAQGQPMAIPSRLQEMTDLTNIMVRDSLDAFVRMDAALARRVCRLDEQVDACNRDIIRELIGVMKTRPDLIEQALNLFSASRHLERIADHATNIAEDVVYLVEGEIIRHHPEALQPRADNGKPGSPER